MEEFINIINNKKEEIIREYNNGADKEFLVDNNINDDYIKGLQNGLDLAVMLIKENFNILDYHNYITFILGYDLLNKELKESDQPECDLAYEQCKILMREFLISDFNKSSKGLYDCLEDFIKDKLENF